MLCWDAQVAGVAEGVHAFARGEEGVEAGAVGVGFEFWLWGLLLLGGRRWLVGCDRVVDIVVVGGLVELRGGLLFLESAEGGLRLV